MKKANQDTIPDPTANSRKRKRGRPQKLTIPEVQNSSPSEAADVPEVQHQDPRGNTSDPPAHGGLKRNQPHLVDRVDGVDDVMLGQRFSGVVEAEFDAGYLLTVSLGNPQRTLRGVVFKPGCHLPVSAENDVAPGVPMIQRVKIPRPERKRQTQASNANSRTAPVSADPGPSNGKKMPLAKTRAASVAAEDKEVAPPAIKDVYVVSECKQAPAGAVKTFPPPPPPPSSSQIMLMDRAMTHGNGVHQASHERNPWGPFYNISEEIWRKMEAFSMTLPPWTTEKLLRKVISSVQGKSRPLNGGAKNLKSEELIEADKPVIVEPLPPPGFDSPPSSARRYLEHSEMGRMAELLQAVQEAERHNQEAQAKEPDLDGDAEQIN
ncbi:SM-ATX domain-containing protein [Psidium guajava]|nr:SM-ATX domain-containing protein [Psidium guajava]